MTRLQIVNENTGTGLIRISEIKQATDLDWLKEGMAKNAAMIALAHKLKDEHAEHAQEQVDAARDLEVRQRYYERRIGQLLAQTVKRGRPKSLENKKGVTVTLLENLGITKNESKRWQKLAQCSDAMFDKTINTLMSDGKSPTRNAVIRIVAPSPPSEFSYGASVTKLLKVLDEAVETWPAQYLDDLLVVLENSVDELKWRIEKERANG